MDSLASLRDIHMPPPASNWPPAPGWIILLIIFCAITICVSIVIIRNYKVWQTRKHALALLKKYKKQYPKIINSQRACSLVNELLKKTAFAYYPRSAIAALTGQEWINFLNQSLAHSSLKNKVLHKICKPKDCIKNFNNVSKELLEYPYQNPQEVSLDELFSISHTWINNQQRLRLKDQEQLCLN